MLLCFVDAHAIRLFSFLLLYLFACLFVVVAAAAVGFVLHNKLPDGSLVPTCKFLATGRPTRFSYISVL